MRWPEFLTLSPSFNLAGMEDFKTLVNVTVLIFMQIYHSQNNCGIYMFSVVFFFFCLLGFWFCGVVGPTSLICVVIFMPVAHPSYSGLGSFKNPCSRWLLCWMAWVLAKKGWRELEGWWRAFRVWRRQVVVSLEELRGKACGLSLLSGSKGRRWAEDHAGLKGLAQWWTSQLLAPHESWEKELMCCEPSGAVPPSQARSASTPALP